MKLDKYDCLGQMNIFDILEPKTESSKKTILDYAEEAVLHGTGFEGGKKRVYELYQRNLPSNERAKVIKKEYGQGGSGWPLKGYGLHGYDSFRAEGLNIEYRDEDGEHRELVSWQKVEGIIHKLVDKMEYYSPPKRICHATNEECNHGACRTVAIQCCDIDCKANCCQSCTELCGARCNYSAHQPKVCKEYLTYENQTWVDNPNYIGEEQ